MAEKPSLVKRISAVVGTSPPSPSSFGGYVTGPATAASTDSVFADIAVVSTSVTDEEDDELVEEGNRRRRCHCIPDDEGRVNNVCCEAEGACSLPLACSNDLNDCKTTLRVRIPHHHHHHRHSSG
jgi:hypothetical protein